MELRMPDPCTIHQWCIYPHWHIPHIWLVFMVHVVQIGFRFNFRDLRSDWFDFDMKVLSVSGFFRTIYQNVISAGDFQPFPVVTVGHLWSRLNGGERPADSLRTLRSRSRRPFFGMSEGMTEDERVGQGATEGLRHLGGASKDRKDCLKWHLSPTDPHRYGLPWIGTSRLVTSVTSHSQLMLD